MSSSSPPSPTSNSTSSPTPAERELDFEAMTERGFAIWLCSRLDKSLGLTGDPMRSHPPCAACGQRGPLVPMWRRWTADDWNARTPEGDRRAATTFVCADGCPQE